MKNSVITHIEASINVKKAILNDDITLSKIEDIAIFCLDSLKAGGKIIFAGNGGSFADAQHLSAEFISRFMFDRAPLASLVLGANNSTITAIGNDYGYENVFARELAGVAKRGDVFIPISTSGNSSNIILAIKCAMQMGLRTIGLTGGDGGAMSKICDCLKVPSAETARVQECHIMIGHIVCGMVEQQYFLREC